MAWDWPRSHHSSHPVEDNKAKWKRQPYQNEHPCFLDNAIHITLEVYPQPFFRFWAGNTKGVKPLSEKRYPLGDWPPVRGQVLLEDVESHGYLLALGCLINLWMCIYHKYLTHMNQIPLLLSVHYVVLVLLASTLYHSLEVFTLYHYHLHICISCFRQLEQYICSYSTFKASMKLAGLPSLCFVHLINTVEEVLNAVGIIGFD